MYLKDFFPKKSKVLKKVFFSGISFNSSDVKKGHIFFAIKGNKVDGNKFINQAIKNGAKIIINEKKILNKYKNILGTIESIKGESILIKSKEEEIQVNFNDIKKANLQRDIEIKKNE